ncbi:cysteine dioxygenase [Xanthobacter flavus]|uniref:cysteine dioxygenase family protein n=1 Tax=Xanthobacter flavus TaxID=281 RepID=UPI00372709DB
MTTPESPLAPTDPAPIAPLRDFVVAFGRLLDERPVEARILTDGAPLLAELVSRDNWLPAAYAAPHPTYYQQYLLHADSTERFSIVSFVWGPGQKTPVHDHTVWGLIGMLQGAEYNQPYVLDDEGRPRPSGDPDRLEPGAVAAVSPTIGDLHRVSNAFDDRVSISIHVYGANIGGVHRHTYPEDGPPKPFVSGYSNTTLPNLWDRSKDGRRSA